MSWEALSEASIGIKLLASPMEPMIRRSPWAGMLFPVAEEVGAGPGCGSSLPFPHPEKIERETRITMGQIKQGILISEIGVSD